ncbi:ATP-binding protein [Candidatus Saccharibacteria bacterium]|nr:ATP-binding protein [Candidatus Saccharibacteria bacterium]
MDEKKYLPRLVDNKLEKYLRIFGAVSIEGAKWCGKTWTGLKYAKSVSYLTDKSVRNLAEVDPKYIFTDERPQLIDEWQIVPPIWDSVRHACDEAAHPGNFILTGSTTLAKEEGEGEVYHTGTGRIATLKMYPMSLLESGDSDGKITIEDMFDGKTKGQNLRKVELHTLAHLAVRGGWPNNLQILAEDAGEIPKSYIESIVTRDIHERKDRKRDPEKMRMLIRSLARNESTVAGNDTLVKDIEAYENEGELIESRHTVADYLGVLNDLYLTSDQPAFSINYRSSQRVGKSPKRHLVDPSLACAALGLTEEKLLNDHNTFGLIFEALMERDLRIYAEYLGGRLYHFRDNASGDEVDAIIELDDSRYAAFEIKLSDNAIQEGIDSLVEFEKGVKRKPEFLCVIVGHLEAAYQDPDSGVYIVPATSLGVRR